MSVTPQRVGWMFVGLYCAALVLIVAFIFSPYASYMSGLLIMVAALPWPLIGEWISPKWGLAAGAALGFVLNAAAAYGLGYASGIGLRRLGRSSPSAGG